MILVGLGGPPFTICTKYCFLVLFRRFWPAQSSPAAEILHAALIGPGDYYKIRNNKLDTHFCSKPHELSNVPIEPPKNPQLLYSTKQAK